MPPTTDGSCSLSDAGSSLLPSAGRIDGEPVGVGKVENDAGGTGEVGASADGDAAGADEVAGEVDNGVPDGVEAGEVDDGVDDGVRVGVPEGDVDGVPEGDAPDFEDDGVAVGVDERVGVDVWEGDVDGDVVEFDDGVFDDAWEGDAAGDVVELDDGVFDDDLVEVSEAVLDHDAVEVDDGDGVGDSDGYCSCLRAACEVSRKVAHGVSGLSTVHTASSAAEALMTCKVEKPSAVTFRFRDHGGIVEFMSGTMPSGLPPWPVVRCTGPSASTAPATIGVVTSTLWMCPATYRSTPYSTNRSSNRARRSSPSVACRR